jgi:hypothetical protein
MNTKVIAQIKKEAAIDPRIGNKSFYAALSPLSEGGIEYGLPPYFSGYEEVGVLLKREAGVTHQELQDRYPVFERAETVQLFLTVANAEQIKNLGFDRMAA